MTLTADVLVPTAAQPPARSRSRTAPPCWARPPSAPPRRDAQATFTTSALAAGSHSLTAVYSGDSNYSASTSLAVSVGIQAGRCHADSEPGGRRFRSGAPAARATTESFSSGLSLTDLFDGQAYAQAGIPTQLGSANPPSADTRTPSNLPPRWATHRPLRRKARWIPAPRD